MNFFSQQFFNSEWTSGRWFGPVDETAPPVGGGIRLWDGKILIDNGEIAVSDDCCCQSTVGSCGCEIPYPSSFLMTASGIDDSGTSCPVLTNECDGINGPYTLEQPLLTQCYWEYRLDHLDPEETPCGASGLVTWTDLASVNIYTVAGNVLMDVLFINADYYSVWSEIPIDKHCHSIDIANLDLSAEPSVAFLRPPAEVCNYDSVNFALQAVA